MCWSQQTLGTSAESHPWQSKTHKKGLFSTGHQTGDGWIFFRYHSPGTHIGQVLLHIQDTLHEVRRGSESISTNLICHSYLTSVSRLPANAPEPQIPLPCQKHSTYITQNSMCLPSNLQLRWRRRPVCLYVLYFASLQDSEPTNHWRTFFWLHTAPTEEMFSCLPAHLFPSMSESLWTSSPTIRASDSHRFPLYMSWEQLTVWICLAAGLLNTAWSCKVPVLKWSRRSLERPHSSATALENFTM